MEEEAAVKKNDSEPAQCVFSSCQFMWDLSPSVLFLAVPETGKLAFLYSSSVAAVHESLSLLEVSAEVLFCFSFCIWSYSFTKIIVRLQLHRSLWVS